MALSAGLIWSWSTNETLLGDEWGYAYRTSTQSTAEFMFNPPPGKHLIAVPLLLYKVAFDAFGIASFVPYRVAHIVLLLLCAALFYALARQRVGDALAVLPTGILLFLGTAWEVVATPLRSPSLIAIAAGLGMLLALERRDLRGDIAAFILLALSLASHSTSFAFAAAGAVLVLSRPSPSRWRSAWVVVLPVLAYVIWWVLEFDAGPSESLTSTIAGMPAFLVKSVGVTVLAASGTFIHNSQGQLAIPKALEVVIGLVLIALLAAVAFARFRQRRHLSAFTWAMAAALITFWIATALAPGPTRSPLASRYLYPDVVLFFLLLCEVGRDFELPRRLTRRLGIAIIALFAVSMAGNVYELRTQERAVNAASDNERAGLTALTLADGGVPDDFSLYTALAGRFPRSDVIEKLPSFALDETLAAYGSPAYSLGELASRPESVRLNADYVSLQGTGSGLRPSPALPPARSPAPRALSVIHGDWATGPTGCLTLRPSGGTAAGTLSLPSDGLTLAVGSGPPATVTAGRVADGTPLPMGTVPGDQKAIVHLATGRAPQPWRVGIRAEQSVLACNP